MRLTKHIRPIQRLNTNSHRIYKNHFATKFYSPTSFVGDIQLPPVKNEPFQHYAPGSKERELLLEECKKYSSPDFKPFEIPVIVNGKEIKTDNTFEREFPADNKRTLFVGSKADKKLIQQAIDGLLAAKPKWEAMRMEDKAAIFLRAADLISTKYRYKLLAATMVGQGKTMWQAEIDAAVETIDFLRFNAQYAVDMMRNQPKHHDPSVWNRLDYRPLEGFITAISPFNFTAIGSNLCCSPLQMGNVVLWKPSSTATLANYITYDILREAGLPDGVLQFLPTDGRVLSEVALNHPYFGGLHFTGSTSTFNHLQHNIMQRVDIYRSYPRVVGETGGKNFHIMHESANIDNFVNNTLRGSFEYSGQKCSATSRIYVPDNRWDEVRQKLVDGVKNLKVGPPHEPSSFLSSVIDGVSFKKIAGYIDRAKDHSDAEVIAGGNYSDEKGWFVDPTIIHAKDPHYETMREEIFGPVVTCYVYPANKFEETLHLIDETAEYGLTGAIFSLDREAITKALSVLRQTAGNFYINDKSTGSIVGQQPFGGARKSGTNDKAGSHLNLLRWTSVRSIKENFSELTSPQYPSTME